MPTNLPPDYYEVEERYKAAQTQDEKVRLLEELISTIPKHKGTDHLRADLRRRMSKLKNAGEAQKKSGGYTSEYHIDKEGAAQVVVIGHANTGKSSLVKLLTNAEPDVQPFPFSTWGPTPGMMRAREVPIQLIDTPPTNREFLEPDFLQMIRIADLILLMVDIQGETLTQIEECLEILISNRIIPKPFQEQHPQRGNVYIPILVVVNKTDTESLEEDYTVFCDFMDINLPCLPLSITNQRHIEDLKHTIFDLLKIIRVYSKAPGKEPEKSAPFVLPIGGTVEQFAGKVHKDFVRNFKSARVWGGSSFDGQMVSKDYVLSDGDVVELKIQS